MLSHYLKVWLKQIEAACVGVLVKQKDKILEIVHQAIDEINSGVDISTSLQNALIKLIGVDGLVSECNVLAMPAILTKVTSKDGRWTSRNFPNLH